MITNHICFIIYNHQIKTGIKKIQFLLSSNKTVNKRSPSRLSGNLLFIRNNFNYFFLLFI